MSLFDFSTKSVKFAAVGDHVTGIVSVAPYERQKTRFGTNQPDFYDNGDPKMQILVPLSTEERDTTEDDGERILYVSSPNMRRAISSAIRDAGALDLEVGGTLTLTFTGFDAHSKNPANPAKLYTAVYKKPQLVSSETVAPALPNAETPTERKAEPADDNRLRELISLGLTNEQITVALKIPADKIAAVRESMVAK